MSLPEPHRLYRIDRFPPTSCPAAAPIRLRGCPPQRYCTVSPQSILRNDSVAGQRSVAAPAGMSIGMVACKVATFRCRWIWLCNTVISLYPTIHLGLCAKPEKSRRSTMRTEPYPPRAQTMAFTSGSSSSCCITAARVSSSPANWLQMSNRWSGSTTSSPHEPNKSSAGFNSSAVIFRAGAAMAILSPLFRLGGIITEAVASIVLSFRIAYLIGFKTPSCLFYCPSRSFSLILLYTNPRVMH